MTRKTGWGKFGSKGVVLLLSLLLLIGLAGGAFAQTEQPLENYATSIKVELKANAQGEELPQYVENGQSLFFGLQISDFKSQELVTYLKANPEADFTIPLNFTGHIEGNYPTQINPDDFDNVAYVGGEPLFRWWIDEDSGVIRVRFDENWIHNASNNTVVENVKLGFDGTLNVADKDVDGKLVFKAANDSFPLQMKTGYAITKTAGKPVYRDGQYVVDFTVKLTLDQKMNIVGTADYDGYAALLTLDDTLNANSAMTGEIVDGPSIAGADGLTVTAAKNGTANTFSFGGVTELNKGTYTIQFTMKLDGNAAAAKLEGYDKQNTVELKENNASLAKPVKADVSIAWDANVSNQFKVDKAILPQSSTTNVYIDGSDYYVDYIVAVYLKNEFVSFTVVDQIVSNAAHSDKEPTLLGVNTAEGFWNSTAKNIPDNLTQMRADVVNTISGSNRTITVTAPEGDMLPAGAYYLKVPVKVTDSVKTLAEAANKKISANQTQDVTVAYKNKAVLDAVDGDTAVNEVSPEVTDTLRAPANFIKRGAIETDSSGTHTIYDKGGLRGKLIRWDVEFSWTIPDQYTVLTDTMKGGQVLLANDNTSFDIWDMSSGTPVSIDKLWNKNDRDYISFDTDANGNETFTFYPGRLSDDPSLSTRKFKLTYYTLVPENTVDFTGMKNNWNISYPNPDTGVAIGPVPGEETPIMGDTVKLTMSKVAKDTAYDVHDMYLRWTVTINNSNKIPMSALGDLKLTEDVDLTRKDGVLKNVDFNVWFDPTSRAPELVMYYGASSTITLEKGVHYSVAVSAEDDSIMVIDFDEAAMAASLAEVGADRFNKIIMTVYTFNTDYNNVGGHTNSTYPRAHIKNTAKLDYATSGMKQDTIESSSTRAREFTTGMKRTAPLDDEWFADYDNDGEKELRWQLEIGSGSFPKMNAIIKAVDTLPEGQKLKYEGSEWKKNFKVYLKSTKNAIMDVPLADDAFSINGDTFELTINKTQNVNNYYNIFIEYYTVFEDGALQDALEKAGADANDITVPLNNQAILYLDGILLQETDITPDLTINNLAVDKSAKFLPSSGSKVNYTIEMNPYGLDMADGDVILLEDSMGDGKDVFSYIPSSFKLINQDTGAQMSSSSAASSTTYVLKMAEDGKSFTLDVPDNTHLKLTYQVKTTQPVGTQDVSLLNNASLAGRKPQQKTITFDVSSAYQSGAFSVRADEAGIRLVKISSEGADGDAPTFLSGAEFTVTRLDSSFQQVGTVQTMTTDAKGLIEIKEKLTDVVYVVVEETKAPEGYRLGSEPWKWCYALVPADKSLSDADVAKLKETVHCDVTVISAGNYVEDSIINEPVTLTVRKVDGNGDLLDGAQFTLRMGDTEIEPDKTHTVAGELRFKNLKAGDYTLAETQAPTGYAVPAECPWNFTLDANGSVTFAKAYGYLALSDDGLYLRVINTPETSAIMVKKVWNDNADQDGKRNGVVANVILSKTVDGVTTDIESVKVDPEDDWSYEWFNLPVYKDNKPITYSIREELVEANGYTSDTTEAKEVIKNGVVTITNTYVPELTSATVKKIWDDEENQDGKRPDKLVVTLSDGTKAELNEGNDWTSTLENLPKYADGEEIVYTWTEDEVPEGYTQTGTVTTNNVTIITNSHTPELTTATVKKSWDDKDNQDGKRPETLTVTLSDGTEVELNEGNGWTATVENLPKYADGEEIVYSWSEGDMPEGYTLTKTNVNGTITTLTNSYTPDLTSATVKKNWDDADNQDGKRPETLTVTLSDGTEVELNEGNSWTATVENLPKYADGEEIVYTWTEEKLPDGYTLTKTDVNGTVTTLTNSYTPELTSATVKKSWDDADNQDGKRPETLTVTLSDGTEVELNEGNGWEATVENLPKYADGEEIVYTWTEEKLPEGYTLTKTDVNGTVTTLTNSYAPEQIDLSGSKTWDDKDNQDGKRPSSISITLLADGQSVRGPIMVTAEDGWSWIFTDLPKYKDQGTEIIYTVAEDDVPGYFAIAEGMNVTNSYAPELTSATVKKIWDDEENQDGKRPEALTVTLSDGTEVELNEGNGWEATVENLPKYADGEEIVYTWTEDEVPEGYTQTGTETKDNVTIITNSHTPELTTATVKKIWDDEENQDGKRPEALTVTLSDGTEMELNEGNGWEATVENLPKYADGEEIVYTWTEEKLPEGYTLTKTNVNGTITTLTNSYTPELTSATVKKNWDDKDNQDGKRPETLTVTLSDGTEVELNEGNGWEATVENLPKYEDGEEIVYTWTEGDMPEGYTLTETNVNGMITTLTNSYTPELTSATVKKSWEDKDNQDGKRPETLTVTLSDGTEVELNEGNSWTATVENLPKYADGEEIVYTWTEEKLPDGYTLTKTDVNGTVTTLTNSYTPEQIDLSGSKTWDDKDDQDGIRPDSITINLFADGTVVRTVTVTEANGWKWSFTDLPKYKDQGVEIVYTITEDTVDGYKSEVNGFDVTNTHEPETVEVTVTKIWNDRGNQGNSRPESLTVALLANEEKTAVTATLNEANGWTETLKDLPKYENGEEIAYSWDEVTVPDGYTISSRVTQNGVTTITNDYAADGSMQLGGTKTLTGTDLQTDQFSFTLTDGDGVTETVKNDADGKFSFSEIKYTLDDVGEHTYTVTEVNDGKSGYTYDDAEYEVIVTVADAGDGTLTVTYTVNGTENGDISFKNEYAANGSVQFGGTKTLTGTDLQADQFSFTLTDGDGVTETVKNDADGKFNFSEIEYDLDDVGEHTYTVTEVNDGQAGYTYDDTEYEIIVTVADAGNGTLNVTYTVNGTENGDIVFGNAYESAGSIRIQGQKLVQGEAPEGDETFTFQLKDADGGVLQEAENQGSLIVFEEIPYTLADDGKTNVYTIVESTESDASWQTDDSEYTLTVTLTDDGAGSMTTDWTLEKNGEAAETILFNNIPLNSLTVEKTVVGGDAEKAFAFKVTLTDADGKELNGTYPVNGADVSSIASGEYLHLKNGEKAEITYLPVGTKYTVEEDEYIAYTPAVNGTEGRKAEGTITEDGAAVTFVNTEKKVSFSVTKEWQGDIGDAITLTLYGNGEKLNPQPSYNKNGDVYSYENLPQYDADGKTVVYSAKEKYMDGFMTIYRNKAPYTEETSWIYNGGTIINRAVTEFRVQKVWEGLEEGEEIPEITLTLYCNGEAMDKKTPKPDEDGWYVWYNLPIVRNGETAQYTVVEEPVDGFTVTYGEDEEATFATNGDTIVNRKIPKTGDDSRIGLWLAVTAVSAAGCILLLKKRKEAK